MIAAIVRYLLTCSRCGTRYSPRVHGQCPGCELEQYTPRA